jgi:hypothetical protein
VGSLENLQVRLDIGNFGNLLNRNWGKPAFSDDGSLQLGQRVVELPHATVAAVQLLKELPLRRRDRASGRDEIEDTKPRASFDARGFVSASELAPRHSWLAEFVHQRGHPARLCPHPSSTVPAALRARLVASLQEAYQARRGVPPALEMLVREYAHAQHEAGVRIEQLLVEIKALIVETVLEDAAVFTPRVVGWTVAGYYDRSVK